MKLPFSFLFLGVVLLGFANGDAAEKLPRNTEPSKLFWIGTAPADEKKSERPAADAKKPVLAFETTFLLDRVLGVLD